MNVDVGDRIKITLPAAYPFTAGWAIGTVLSVQYSWTSNSGDEVWALEVDKEEVDPRSNWKTGYGYWKFDQDGGTVEILEGGD